MKTLEHLLDSQREKDEALMIAARSGRLSDVEALLTMGADPNGPSGSELNGQRLRVGNSPLHLASAGGHAIVCAALVRGGAQVGVRNSSGDAPKARHNHEGG